MGSGAGGCVRTHLKHARLFGRAGRAVVPGNSHLCFKGRGWKEDGERIAVLRTCLSFKLEGMLVGWLKRFVNV